MSPAPPSAALGRRTGLIGALLLGALGLSGVLAYQAIDAGRSHEEVAVKVAKEQASFAAWEFTDVARRMLLDKLVKPGLEVVARSGGKDSGLVLTRPPQDAEEWGTWSYGTMTGTFFRIDLATGDVSTAGPSDPELEAWLAGEAPAHFALDLGEGWDPVLVDLGGGAGPIAYRTYPEGERPEVIFGLRLKPESLAIPLGYAFGGPPLLPESLTGGRDNGSLFYVSVSGAEREGVWDSGRRYWSEFTAKDTLGLKFAGYTASLTVNPAIAESLVIGGFPNSRLPLVIVLLLVTGGLVVAALLQLRREAELAQLRADFVSGVSHELRTPLAQIRMFAETLLLGRVRSEEERERSLEIIANESKRLTHQVENVLLYARAERRDLRVALQTLDLGALVRETASAFAPLAEKVRSSLRVDAASGIWASVDPELIRQVLLNLLDNATKYGPTGQTITVGAGHAPGGWVRVWVEDEGPGIPEEKRTRIWEPYFRLPAHRESAVAGSGIGLSVVHQAVEALGGSVAIEEAEGGGARFVVSVRSAPAPAQVGVGD